MGRLKIAFDFRKQSESSATHLRSFISKVNKQFTQVTTVRENDDEIEVEEYLFEADFEDQHQDDPVDVQTSSNSIKEFEIHITESLSESKIKSENVENETAEELVFVNNEDEHDGDSNDDVEQMEEVIMGSEVYEEEHLLDDVYLEEQVRT